MICPDCKTNFPLTYKRYFFSSQGVHCCPNCHFIGKLVHLSKRNEILHFIIFVVTLISISSLTEIFFENILSVGYGVGSFLGIFLAIIISHFANWHYEIKFSNFVLYKKNWWDENAIKILVCLLLAFLTSLPIISIFKTQHLINNFNTSQSLEPHIQEILADLKLISENPPFPDSPETKDAGPYINEQHIPLFDIKIKNADLPYIIVNKIFNKNAGWKTDPIKFRKLKNNKYLNFFDTAWLNKLDQFDYWKFENNTKYKSELARVSKLSGLERNYLWANLPIPNYNILRKLALINFFQYHHQGKSIEGLKTIRKLATLFHSSGNIVGNTAAVILLRDENFLIKALDIKQWYRIPENIIEAYRRASWSWSQIYQVSWFRDLPQIFEPYLKKQYGMCAGVLEGLIGLPSVQDYLRPHFLFETNFSHVYEKHFNFLQTLFTICHKEEHNVFLADMPNDSNPWFLENSDQDDSPRYNFNFSRLPYMRRIIGLEFLFDGSRRYLELIARKKAAQKK